METLRVGWEQLLTSINRTINEVTLYVMYLATIMSSTNAGVTAIRKAAL